MLLLPGMTVLAQQEEPPVQEGKFQERMREYIQDKLSLSRSEAERFTPVFIRYFREFAITHRAYKADKLVFQQKIIELRLRYRNEFRQIMDEQRANRVFRIEDEFRIKAQEIIQQSRRERMGGGKPLRQNRLLIN
jgi:hypothetical protein